MTIMARTTTAKIISAITANGMTTTSTVRVVSLTAAPR